MFRDRPSPDLPPANCPKAGYTTQASKMKVWTTKKEVDSRVYTEQKPLYYRMNTFNCVMKKTASQTYRICSFSFPTVRI